MHGGESTRGELSHCLALSVSATYGASVTAGYSPFGKRPSSYLTWEGTEWIMTLMSRLGLVAEDVL